MILEEAAYCDEGMINEVVLPLLAVQSSVLLCISTLLENDNHYSRMFSLENDDGTPLFEQIQISLVCDKCMATDHPERCTHKTAEMPRWLSSKKLETIKKLLSGDPAMLLRESMGVSAESTTRAFRETDIQRFLERPLCTLSPMRHVFVAVDPAAGGTSAFAICTIGIALNGSVVVRRAPTPTTALRAPTSPACRVGKAPLHDRPSRSRSRTRFPLHTHRANPCCRADCPCS